MPLDLVKAVTAEAHRQGRLVFAHPQNLAGLQVAVEGGIDILAHTTPDEGESWSASLVAQMKSAGVSLAPTLKLWRFELEKKHAAEQDIKKFLRIAQDQLQAYSRAGGQVLFGTDVGYMPQYDPADEYRLMARQG